MFPKQPSGDITHICFLQLVVLAPITVDTHEDERIDYGIDVETHVDESVDQILVVALVPVTDRQPTG